MVTFWIPLTPVPKNGSALHFVDESHIDLALFFWHGKFPKKNKASNTDLFQNIDLSKRYGGDKSINNYMPLQIGDVTVHSGWTLHTSDPLSSPEKKLSDGRIALSISYVCSKAMVRKVDGRSPSGDNGHDEDYDSYKGWIDRIKPGRSINVDDIDLPVIF